MDLALLVLRAVLGTFLAAHGAQKLFAWLGGPGLRRTSEWLGSVGFSPSTVWAVLAGTLELCGGVLFALGLLCPLGSLGIGASMSTAIAKIHRPRVWATDGGFELPLKNLAVVLAVDISGPGAFSLDHVLRLGLPANAAIFGAAAVTCGWVLALISSTLAVASSDSVVSISAGGRFGES